MSKIEQCIEDLEAYLDSCKAQAFSNNKKIVVDRDEIDEILAELRQATPDEIKKYQRIVANQEAILNHSREEAATRIQDAEDKAKDTLLRAKKQAADLVEEHVITQKAYKRATEIMNDASSEAQRIVDQAATEADSLRTRTVNYADDVMASLQQVIASSMTDFQVRFDQLGRSLKSSYDIISNDRRQLAPESIYAPEEPAPEQDLPEDEDY